MRYLLCLGSRINCVDPEVGGYKRKAFFASLKLFFFVFAYDCRQSTLKIKKPCTPCKAFLLSG